MAFMTKKTILILPLNNTSNKGIIVPKNFLKPNTFYKIKLHRNFKIGKKYKENDI